MGAISSASPGKRTINVSEMSNVNSQAGDDMVSNRARTPY